MPCGGIYPIKGSWVEKVHQDKTPCWVCMEAGCTHFCDEWDTPLHARCVLAFLQTEEGKCVIEHGHLVQIDYSVEEPRP